jgi:hypothetical protein
MKAVITRDLRLEGGALVRNAEFLRFAHHCGFRPRACRPCRAQTIRFRLPAAHPDVFCVAQASSVVESRRVIKSSTPMPSQ